MLDHQTLFSVSPGSCVSNKQPLYFLFSPCITLQRHNTSRLFFKTTIVVCALDTMPSGVKYVERSAATLESTASYWTNRDVGPGN